VLTVIIFGGTTARMLEILNIRTGVVEEIDSDDEFDIEYVADHGGTYSRKSGAGIGHIPRGNGLALGNLDPEERDSSQERGTYSSGNVNGNGHTQSRTGAAARRNSTRNGRSADSAEQGLLSPIESGSASLADGEDEAADLDLPPAARRVGNLLTPSPRDSSPGAPYPTSGSRSEGRPGEQTHAGRIAHATGAISQLISGLSEDPAQAFRQIDEDFIKPRLLLDPGSGHGGGHGGS
jgi:sodium/hydrogen exchanger-like protein 6/7